MELTRTRRALARLKVEIEKTYLDEKFAKKIGDRETLQNVRVRRQALLEAVTVIETALEGDEEGV